MTHKFWLLLGLPFPIPQDNDGGDGDPAPDDGGDDGDDGDDPDPDLGLDTGGQGDKPKFTQKQVNDIVVKRNKALKTQYQQLEKSYQSLLEDQNLNQEQRSRLENDLENVQAQLRTKEQQAAHEAKQASERARKEVEEADGQRDYYRNLYETETKQRSITDAAAKHGAYNPAQFISILGEKTKIVEEVNDKGEKTGRLVPRVELTIQGEDGSPVNVLKDPSDAIEDLKADVDNYGNLFKSNVARGVGDGTTPGAGGRIDPTKMTDEEYFKNRAAIQENLGIRKRRNF